MCIYSMNTSEYTWKIVRKIYLFGIAPVTLNNLIANLLLEINVWEEFKIKILTIDEISNMFSLGVKYQMSYYKIR